MADKIKFWPIRGMEAQILDQPYYDGKISFAYDTNKIYLDVNGARHLMGGGSSGIAYANGSDEQITKQSEDDNDTRYSIAMSALENSSVEPQPDDLILNSDGRFFRVISVDSAERIINAVLLAVSGTGGGGGGGGGGVVQQEITITPDIQTVGSSFTYISGQHYNISFTINVTTGDNEANVTLDFFSSSNVNAEPVYKIIKNGVPVGEPITVDLSEVSYIGSGITLRITAEAANASKAATRLFNNLRFVEMRLDKPAGSGYIGVVSDKDVGGLILAYVPYGSGLTLTLHGSVDGIEFPLNVTLTNQNMGQRQTVGIPDQSHGTHIVNLWVSTEINGVTLESERISYEAAWVKSEETVPVIWVGPYPETVIQYENAIIPYMVYDPVQTEYGLSTEVHFYHNGVEIAASPVNVTYSNTEWLTWDVTSIYKVGENRFTIVNGVSSKEVVINITTEGSRDLGLVNEVGLLTNFTSAGRSSSEIKANRATWKSSVGNFSAEFNDFNWYNNGWKDDSDGQGSYLSIANDASVRIPYGNLSINNDRNFTFEIRFRVRNIQKYSTLVTQIPLYKYWMPPFLTDSQGNVVGGQENNKGDELTLEEITERGYVVKLDSDGNKEMEQSNPTRKIVERENGVAFKYLNGDGYGFAIGTQEAYFATAGRVVNVRYKEDEIINISFVVDKTNTTLYIYLNGILTGAADLNNVPYFTMQAVPFEINSKYCDFDLYKFRIYQVGLTMPEVIHNYLSDMKDISLYDENQLTNVNDDTQLDYNKMLQYNEDHPDDPIMPYAVIDMSMYDDDRLPYIKADNNTKRAAITFVNPTADRLLEKGLITEYQYYTHCPSYTSEEVDINVQGTSSQGYPRRNYKTKFKTAGTSWIYTKGSLAGQPVMGALVVDEQGEPILDKKGKKQYGNYTLSSGETLVKNWHEDNENLATNKFTWKIDYMESSGSYNTGFANMMGNNLYSKHPLEDLGYDATGYRTSVYGFPLLVFHKKKDGSYVYIGRYNMNLDKSANEYYGFESSNAQPYITDEEGKHPKIKDIAECWELRDNQGIWCSFKYPNPESREIGFGTQAADATQEAPKLEIPLHFEPRYHAESDQIEAAAAYQPVQGEDDYTEDIGADNASMCSYLRSKYANLEVLFNWLDSTDTDQATNHEWTVEEGGPRRLAVASTVDNDPTVTYEQVQEGSITKTYGTFTADTKEYRRQKFKAEFSKHLDEHYCAIYFIMTELLLCYDSRGKNMMIATFGPREEGGDYIWYPIFYDIDTQLGLNNVGALLWDYNEDATENKTFSTAESVLWVNFADMFKGTIQGTYASLRSGGDSARLSYNTIEGAYTCNPNIFKTSYAMRGKRPIIAIGLDEFYKYLAPITQGYYDTAGTIQTGSSGNYLYACQGDRMLSRELFITNRLNYMDSKWPAGAYDTEAAKQEIYMRLNANYAGTSDIYLDSNSLSELPATARPEQQLAPYPVPFLDTVPQYTVTPFLDQYVTVFYDENRLVSSEAFTSEKYPDGMKTYIDPGRLDSFKTKVIQQQIIYFPAGDYLSSLGDMSTKYIDSIGLYHGKRLLDITLGSDIPGYYNDQAGSGTIFSLGDDANSNNKKTLLKKINLTGLRRLAEFQDVSGSEKLQEFRALNTSLPYAVFAKGAPLNTLHLPKSTTELRLAENRDLINILTEKPEVLDLNQDGTVKLDSNGKPIYKEHEEYEGLYLEDITDYDPNRTYAEECKLTTIQTDGDSLGYGLYTILKNTVARKRGTTGTLAIQMNNVHWTPYVQVEYGEAQNNHTTYYLLTDHSTYVEYEGDDPTEWNSLTLNGRIYTYDSSMDANTITDLTLFNEFIADYERNAANGTINQFTNTNGSPYATRPTITGEMFVNNTTSRIREDELTSKYGAAWPQLTIRVANVIESNLAKYIQIDPSTGKEVELDVIRYNPDTSNGQPVTLTSKPNPYRQYYDFIGWSYEPIADGTSIDVINNKLAYDARTNEWTALGLANVFSASNTVISLYAVFTQTLYTIYYMNPDDTVITTRAVTYGQPIPDPQEVPTYDPGNLDLEEVYSFKGYTREKANALPANKNRLASILLTLNKTSVTENDIRIYAVYIKQSVYDEPTNLSYFTFTASAYQESTSANILPIDSNSDYNITGVTINIKPGVHLAGKITLPTYSPSGQPVISIGETFAVTNYSNRWPSGCLGGKDITHIFWYPTDGKECELRMLDERAFASDNRTTDDQGNYIKGKLKYVEFGPKFRVIGASAFFMTASLDLRIFELPETLVWVRNAGLNTAFDENINVDIFRVPASVVNCDLYSFVSFAPKVGTFVFGDTDHGSHLTILNSKDLTAQDYPASPIFTPYSSSSTPNGFEFYAYSEAQRNGMDLMLREYTSVAPLFSDIPIGNRSITLASDHI